MSLYVMEERKKNHDCTKEKKLVKVVPKLFFYICERKKQKIKFFAFAHCILPSERLVI